MVGLRVIFGNETVSCMSDEFLWVEKYRPKTIEDCVLPDNIKQTFFDIKYEIPNMILTGTGNM